MLKNTASQKYHVKAFNASGSASGQAANITCTLAKDDGTRAALTDVNPVEIGTTGEYVFDLTQAETNGYKLSFIPSCSTEGVEVVGMPSNVIYTEPTYYSQMNIDSAGRVMAAPSITGPRTITLTFLDGDDNAVRNVVCEIAGVDYQVSDSEGKVVFRLSTAAHTIAISPPYGFAIPDDYSVNAGGSSVTADVVLSAVAVPESTNPNACQCTLSVLTAHDTPITGAVLTATTAQSVAFADDALLFPVQVSATSDNGQIVIYLIQTLTYNVSVSYQGRRIQFQVTVPETETASIADIVL